MNTQDKLFKLKEIGYSMYRISNDLGINQSTLSRILNGKIIDPKESTVTAISDYYKRSCG